MAATKFQVLQTLDEVQARFWPLLLARCPKLATPDSVSQILDGSMTSGDFGLKRLGARHVKAATGYEDAQTMYAAKSSRLSNVSRPDGSGKRGSSKIGMLQSPGCESVSAGRQRQGHSQQPWLLSWHHPGGRKEQ